VTVIALPVATTIEIVGGNGQQGAAGAALAQQPAVRVRDQRGQPMPGVSVAWQIVVGGGSLSPATATTDADGLARTTWTLGTAAGANEARAAVTGLAPAVFTAVGVPGAPAGITVTPDTVTLTSVQDTVRFGAAVFDVHGNPVPAPSIGWTSDPGSIASVDAQGLARALAAGTSRIQAAVGGVTGSATLRVIPAPASVAVTPGSVEINAGGTAQLTAEVRDRNGTPIPGAAVQWSSSSEAIATVDATGRVTGVGPGTATVTATNGAFQGQASVTVRAVAIDCSEIRTFADGATLSGSLPSVRVTGNVTVTGATNICGWLRAEGSGATLDLNGQTVQVDGTFITATGGRLRMQNPADRLIVRNSIAFQGGATEGLLTHGVIRAAREFGGSGTNVFHSTGTRVVLDGTVAQSVNIAGGGNSRFHDLVVANTSAQGVQFAPTRVTGNLVVETPVPAWSTSHAVTIDGELVTVAGSSVTINSVTLNHPSGTSRVEGSFSPTLTEFRAPNPQIRPGLGYRAVLLTGSAALTGATVIDGTLNVDGSAAGLDLNGQSLEVRGSLQLLGRATLRMTNEADRLDVRGTVATTFGGDSRGLLTAGEIRVGGNFFAGAGTGDHTFHSTGTRVVFDGTAEQTISLFSGDGVGSGSRFHDVVVANTATSGNGAFFSQRALVTGGLDLAGRMTVRSASFPVRVDGTLILRGSAVLSHTEGGLTVGGCEKEPGHTIIGQDPCPCVLPSLPPGFSAQGVTRAQLPVAMGDAATRISAGLPDTPARAALVEALQQLRTQLQGTDALATCSAFNLATQRLAAVPDDPPARPDRDATRHVLDLTNAVIRPQP
jgi:hypothetical protein